MSTKDWLLDRLVQEHARHEETKRLYQESLVEIDELNARLGRAEAHCVLNEEQRLELEDLRERVKRLVPEKQFRVVLRAQEEGGMREELNIVSVASSAGKTTITVIK